MKILAEMFLTENKTLKTLDLSDNYIGNEGVKLLSEVLAKHPTLTSLSLDCMFELLKCGPETSDNSFDNGGLKNIATYLEKNSILKTLTLNSTYS